MFAVPGWSVSAATLKTQVEPYKEDPPNLSNPDADDDSDSTTKPSKKRKRGTDHVNGVKITGNNLAELWEKHIEGKGSAKGDGEKHESKSAKRRRKKGKGKENAGKEGGANDMVAQGAKVEAEEVGPAKNAKERKRRKAEPSQAYEHPSAAKPIPNYDPATSSTVNGTPSTSKIPSPSSAAVHGNSRLTPLQQAMREKLVSSRFRYLNQTLYTTPSTSSYELFTQNPTFFTEYHEGFRRQVSVWPENPVDGFIRWIEKRGSQGNRGSLGSQKAQFKKKKKGKNGTEDPQKGQKLDPSDMKDVDALPRDSRSGLCTIADLGCGDAKLAQHFASSTDRKTNGPVLAKPLNLRIHSFDLAAITPLITVADIRSLSLPDSSVDVAIFCLALMGTNWIEFVEEAWRVLRWKGECWIGEVGSRFASPRVQRVEHSVGNRTKLKARGSKGRSGHDEEDGLEDEILAEDERPASSALAQSPTDVSAFVEVLRRRGFVLTGEPELGNKMFVRMRFVKASTPTSGKCVPAQRDAGGQPWGKKRFVDRKSDLDDAVSPDMEARVLKPCVYKTR